MVEVIQKLYNWFGYRVSSPKDHCCFPVC